MRIPHYQPTDGVVGGVMPRGFKFTDGFLDADYLAFYPINPAAQPMKWTETVRTSATAEPDDHRGQATAAMHMTRTVDFTESPKS
jgi:hypothetical protein